MTLREDGLAVMSALGGRRVASTLLAEGLVTDLYLTGSDEDGLAPSRDIHDGPPVLHRRVLAKQGAAARRAHASSTWSRRRRAPGRLNHRFGVEPGVALDVRWRARRRLDCRVFGAASPEQCFRLPAFPPVRAGVDVLRHREEAPDEGESEGRGSAQHGVERGTDGRQSVLPARRDVPQVGVSPAGSVDQEVVDRRDEACREADRAPALPGLRAEDGLHGAERRHRREGPACTPTTSWS